MIKISQLPAPAALTPTKVQELTAAFIADGKPVWKGNGIPEQLLLSSHDKCCYCECNTAEESKYMEVEHFKGKAQYPNDVVLWSNLLPSCKRCNSAKNKHDVIAEPIINPYVDRPSEHLCFSAYRLYGITPKGTTTIDAVDLNNRNRLTNVRYQIGVQLIENLEALLSLTRDYHSGISQQTRRRNIIIGKLETLLIESTPKSAYAATAATILFGEPAYQQIKQMFEENDLWTAEFQALEDLARSCVLPHRINSAS